MLLCIGYLYHEEGVYTCSIYEDCVIMYRIPLLMFVVCTKHSFHAHSHILGYRHSQCRRQFLYCLVVVAETQQQKWLEQPSLDDPPLSLSLSRLQRTLPVSSADRHFPLHVQNRFTFGVLGHEAVGLHSAR